MKKNEELKIIMNKDLLKIVSDNSDKSERAFEVFYERFKDFTWRYIHAYLSKYPKWHPDIDCIFEDSFITVYNKSSSYKETIGVTDEMSVKMWLSGIIKNHIKRVYCSSSSVTTISLDNRLIQSYKKLTYSDEHDGFEPKSPIDAYLYRLSPKERNVLLILFTFDTIKNIPNDILHSICSEYGIKKATLRKIRQRSLDKLSDWMRIDGFNVSRNAYRDAF